MDILAHFLWTAALFWNTRYKWWAGLMGFVPDILSFGVLLVAELGHLSGKKPELHTIPSYIFTLYNLTHSYVVWAVLFGVVWFLIRRPPYILLAWALHITIDIFTHSPEYFPTPLFWPLSDWKYLHGVSWGTPIFMAINYGTLAVLYGYIGWHSFSRRKTAQSIKSK